MSLEKETLDKGVAKKAKKFVIQTLYDDYMHTGSVEAVSKKQTKIHDLVDKIENHYAGKNKGLIFAAACLYKIKEVYGIDASSDAESVCGYENVKNKFGGKVANIVSELGSNPLQQTASLSPKNKLFDAKCLDRAKKDKYFKWMVWALWAKSLSKEAQVVLLAKNLCEFNVAKDRRFNSLFAESDKKENRGRLFMCKVIREASPELYNLCERSFIVAGHGPHGAAAFASLSLSLPEDKTPTENQNPKRLTKSRPGFYVLWPSKER